ncbi:MAG: hypothetical protein DMF61_08340 [Blastocatellia bacterium AA13]|nr:MAG: hypothetical protein DMF61_08340 [Blastocatellia bacterium AA13]
MPREHKGRREILDAISLLPSVSGLLSEHDGQFEHEIDLEVVVYGRNYGGKKVGPYVSLRTYESGEIVVKEGDWGGDAFYIVVSGRAEVFVKNSSSRVAALDPPAHFGEMSVLAGVPRNATIKAPADGQVTVLEVQRPALRLLRKLPEFSAALDKAYRTHGKNVTLEGLKAAGFNPAAIDQLRSISLFRVYSKNHVLFSEGALMDRVYIIMDGWINRSIEPDAARKLQEDFLARGYCFGTEGIDKDLDWPYTATVLGRTEALEISISQLRSNTRLRADLAKDLAKFEPPKIAGSPIRRRTLSAQRTLIETGLVDATNLLVMDMDLCVRCGNCSLACHKVHGQSRLLRRGIHVSRLVSPTARSVQSILSPEVCMHCNDPECLTGCPTGAIGRFSGGQIDINTKTCIGCGDCAMNCPYDAISMTPRKGKQAAASGGLLGKLREFLRIAPDPLPSAVEQTDDLLAVKCNLCQGTSLNPPDSKRPAYSCEENCPTGALARVNPREYFTEIGDIEGLLIINPGHAAGRNIHRSDPVKRIINIAGVLLTLLITASALFGLSRYGLGGRLAGFLNMRWLTGLAGLAGIGVVMAYPLRRQIYKKRAGPLRYWLLTHSYAGVIAAVLIFLHSGVESGGLLTTLLVISFDLTIFTGIFGILCYYTAPRLLTKIEGAPLLIDDLRERQRELQKELAETGAASAAVNELVTRKVIPSFLSFRFMLRQYLKRESLSRAVAGAREALKADISKMPSEREKRKLDRAIEIAVTLRRIDSLVFLHRLLKLWIPPHVAATSLMLALVLVHIIQVIYFASR